MARSMRSPSPVRSRRTAAAHTAKAAVTPPARSATGRAGITAAPPSGARAPAQAWAEALHDHVGFRGQLQQPAAPGVFLEVEHQAALVHVEAREELGIGAHGVAPRRLDLEDVGAELGQELRRVRPRTPDREVQDPKSRQQACGPPDPSWG